MFQILTFVAALGAFSAAARVPLKASSKGNGKTDNTDTKYCNSIGCSNGYNPIENAHDVKCDNGKCEERQCCEAFCSYYACPNNYTPVYGAGNIKCE